MSNIIYWWLLIFFIVSGRNCCYCCWNEERIALLQVKAYINGWILTSWVADETSDCCQWEGILCSNTTRRVTELAVTWSCFNAESNPDSWLFNASLFTPFKNLKALLLPAQLLTGWADNEGFEKLKQLRELEKLDLSRNQFNRSTFKPLSQLSSLKSLHLSQNKLGQGSERLSGLDKLQILDLRSSEAHILSAELGGLKSIEYLLLDGNMLDDNFLRSSGVLSALKVLSVADCNLNGTLPLQELCDLQYLEELSLRGNNFIGELPPCLGNLTFLRAIDLTRNQFTGNIASSPLSRLFSLEYLLLANNNFEIPISFESFTNHSKLKVVIAEYNLVTLQTSSERWIPKFQLEAFSLTNCSQMPSFLHYQHHLRFLHLSKGNVGGEFPNWLFENNSRLGEVYLDGNAFTGSLRFSYLPNLMECDISNNKIQGQLPPNIGSMFPNLVIFTMSNNRLEGLLPPSFGDMKNLEWLDLSNNKLKGELPIGPKLYFLRLSNNRFEGEIFPVSDNIGRNNFSGPVPEKLPAAPLSTLVLSYNNLSGNIPAWLGNMSYLNTIALSGNHLTGHIPPDLCRLEGLETLDLSENNLVGVIPSCFSDFQRLGYVYLSKNNLHGDFNMFSSLYLEELDLRDNHFNGSIPKWFGSTHEIITLLLKGNNFHGTIPTELCHARYLRILDLSHNNLSGSIPRCLGNIMQPSRGWRVQSYFPPFLHRAIQTWGRDVMIFVEDSINIIPGNFEWAGVEFTTKYNTYSYEGSHAYYMAGIDLSSNQLSGEIPKELSNLTRIRALNLSHNHITGNIPSKFSNLENIESLDLSYNNLTGRIPTQLLQLTTLEVFSVAHNNLSGMTPDRTAQFGTFNESSYEGNPFLCGPPLEVSCKESKQVPTSTPAPDISEDEDGFLDMESFYITFLVGYANVVLAIVVVLWINPYWRNVWLYYIESFMHSCYYYFVSKCT